MMLFGCDPYMTKLEIVNNSNEQAFYIFLLDTSVINNLPPSDAEKIEPLQSKWPILGNGKGEHFWEDFINEYSKDSSLYIYFFNSIEITEQVINERRYKRYDLKVKDLDSLQWKVVYE